MLLSVEFLVRFILFYFNLFILFYSVSFSLFSQILDIVELKFNESENAVYSFLHSVLAQPFPDPGGTIIAQTFIVKKDNEGKEDYEPESFHLKRTNDDFEYLEYVSYDLLFLKLNVETIILIFKCLLTERRILIVAETLTTLSSCIDAISNMAHPFAWQYVFIPILPISMISYLAAPMPFIIGILSSSLEIAMKEPMEDEVLIIDIDNNKIISSPENTQEILPSSMLENLEKNLKKCLNNSNNKINNNNNNNSESSIKIAHLFLNFFESIFGNYAKYFESSQNNSSNHISTNPIINDYHFNFKRFVKKKSPEICSFLKTFQNYQMFLCFIQEREDWANKGILSYCILLRTHAEKKKGSSVLNFKTKMGKFRSVIQTQIQTSKRSNTIQINSKKSKEIDYNNEYENHNSTTSSEISEDKSLSLKLDNNKTLPQKNNYKNDYEKKNFMSMLLSKSNLIVKTKNQTQNSTENISNLSEQYSFKPIPKFFTNYKEDISCLFTSDYSDIYLKSYDGILHSIYSPILYGFVPDFDFEKSDDEKIIEIALCSKDTQIFIKWLLTNKITQELINFVEVFNLFPSSNRIFTFKKACFEFIFKSTNPEKFWDYFEQAIKNFDLRSSNFKTNENSFDWINAFIWKIKIVFASLSFNEMTPLLRRKLASLPKNHLIDIINIKNKKSFRLNAEKNIQIPEPDSILRIENVICKLLSSKKFFDIEILVPTHVAYDGTDIINDINPEVSFKVHSKIISCRSPFLNKLLFNQTKSQIKINSINSYCLKSLLGFIYCEKFTSLSDDKNQILSIVQAAHILQMDSTQFREIFYRDLETVFTNKSILKLLLPNTSKPITPSERAVLSNFVGFYIAKNITSFPLDFENVKILDSDTWESFLFYNYKNN